MFNFTPWSLYPREEMRYPINRRLCGLDVLQKFPEPTKIRTPERSAHSLVAIPPTPLKTTSITLTIIIIIIIVLVVIR
jgi:hypothetical protein